VSFREATIHDADLLYRWRIIDESRPHYAGTPTSFIAHRQWLYSRLAMAGVRIRVWMEGGTPAGMVRIDSNGELAFYAGCGVQRVSGYGDDLAAMKGDL